VGARRRTLCLLMPRGEESLRRLSNGEKTPLSVIHFCWRAYAVQVSTGRQPSTHEVYYTDRCLFTISTIARGISLASRHEQAEVAPSSATRNSSHTDSRSNTTFFSDHIPVIDDRRSQSNEGG